LGLNCHGHVPNKFPGRNSLWTRDIQPLTSVNGRKGSMQTSWEGYTEKRETRGGKGYEKSYKQDLSQINPRRRGELEAEL